MMNDTVREDAESNLRPLAVPRLDVRPLTPTPRLEIKPSPAPALSRPVMAAAPTPARKIETAELKIPKTSPTLVGFQNKNTPIPEWRLQMQNAVQQRRGAIHSAAEQEGAGAKFPTSGANALKPEPLQTVETASKPRFTDERVANAVRRIEQSRSAFQDTPLTKLKPAAPQKPLQMRPFNVVPPISNGSAAATAPARIVNSPKPTLVSAPPVLEKRDTNKLPPIDEFAISTPLIDDLPRAKMESGPLPAEFAEIGRIRIRAEENLNEHVDLTEDMTDEIEDLAPFSMRFCAGLFDLIIGGFASLLVLSPFAFSGGEWLTGYGALAGVGTFAVFTFLYMTICLGFFGKTMGMRLFSLELVDAVENEYPSLQQAAINSSLFLISLGFAGAGFLTVFFNEERRAIHDLLSGTIIVREF